jgi:hypothetical protein
LLRHQAAKQRPKATTAIAVRAAPEVGSLESAGVSTPMVSNDAKVVKYNPKYEALWAVEQAAILKSLLYSLYTGQILKSLLCSDFISYVYLGN